MGALKQLWNLGNIRVSDFAQAYLTASGITNYLRVRAINQLVIDLQNAGLININNPSNGLVEGLLPFAGVDDNSQKYNLLNPVDSDAAHRATFEGTQTPTLTGSAGRKNGICVSYLNNQYIDPKLIPNVDLAEQNSHIGVFCTMVVASGISQQPVIYSANTSLSKYITLRGVGIGNAYYTQFGGSSPATNITTGTKNGYGHWIIDIGGNVMTTYQDGTVLTSVANSSTIGANAVPILFNAANTEGGITSYGQQSYRAIHWGKHLTTAQSLALYNALSKFKDTINCFAYFYGDSITHGYGASVYTNCWQQKLSNDYNFYQDKNAGIDGQNLYYNGVNTNSLYYHYLQNDNQYIPNKRTDRKELLFLAFGRNDANNSFPVASFATQYSTILNDLIANKGWSSSDIKLINITPIKADLIAMSISDNTSLMNTEIANLASTYGCQLIDVFNYVWTTNPNNTVNWYFDTQHPNDAMYAAMAEFIATQVS